MADEIRDEWPRFFAHWGAATTGYFFRGLLPVLKTWTNPTVQIDYPRWWAALLFAAVVCLIAGGINSNLPIKPREIVKSLGLGFALEAAAMLAKVGLP